MDNSYVKQRIVISAVNFIEGGPLTIFQECLYFASKNLTDRYEIIALVHKKSLFEFPEIRFIEIPSAKRSWIVRLYYEYWGFRRISKSLVPLLWFSLHDITPNVSAERRAVYCHNPAPFHMLKIRDVWLDPKFTLFRFLYRWLYRININKNDYVIVQQFWLKKKFEILFNIKNVVVSYPEISSQFQVPAHNKQDTVYRFIYPALPRIFKNFEVLCEAAKLLLDENINNFEILITIDGNENSYAKLIAKLYGDIKQIKFIGLQSKENIFNLYKLVDCLVFPSKLETWGLPITEFKLFDKPIIAANLEYAHETAGFYHSIRFFDPENAYDLARLLRSIIEKSFLPSKAETALPVKGLVQGWEQLFSLLLYDKH